MQPVFFQISELDFLGQWANTPYQKNNRQQKNASERIKENLWIPTKYWVEELVKRIPGITIKGKADWKESAGKSKYVFKHYTWYRIYLNEYFHPDLFFTLGVDGLQKCLFIKIDFQRHRSKTLTSIQKEYLAKKINEHIEGPFWTSVPASIFSSGNWEALLQFSEKFINDHRILYAEIFTRLTELSIEKRIARLTWNKNGWILPSGKEGKSDDKNSHEFRFGYGHEEWIFDISKVINGYHYAFLEPIQKEQDAFMNKTYHVWLYTIDGESKARYFVGELKNCEAINKEHAEEIKAIYIKNGWLKEMENQIIDANANAKGFSNYKGLDIFNIRFKPSNYTVNDYDIKLPQGHGIYIQSRYVFAHFKPEYNNFLKTNDFVFQESTKENDTNNGLQSKTYTRPPKPVQITYLHDKICKTLTNHLKKKYGNNNVTPEHLAGYGSNRIDIVVRNGKKFIFFEIKTYASVRTSIREAVGQILEYSCWPDKLKAHELVIITQPHSDISEVKTYIRHISQTFHIPLSYQTYDWKSDLLSE
jgi:hypothetical protein